MIGDYLRCRKRGTEKKTREKFEKRVEKLSVRGESLENRVEGFRKPSKKSFREESKR